MNYTPEETALKIGEKITAVDHRFLDMLGIEAEPFQPGRAVCHMTIREDMLNSGKFCHGGFIFFLADNAFAYACLAKNQAMVTLSAHVIFTSAAKLGDRLTAIAQIMTQSGRTSSGDVEIVNQDGETVARFQGVAYWRKDPVLGAKKRKTEE
ncbi:MAG: hotdog fold thioesterase [Chloroflexota bacterium]